MCAIVFVVEVESVGEEPVHGGGDRLLSRLATQLTHPVIPESCQILAIISLG